MGDVGKTYTGLSGKNKEDFGHGEASFVTYMNVYSNPVSDLKMTEPIEIDNHQNEVKYGDVFFTTSSETPEEVGMASVWTGDKNNTYLNSFCFGYRPLQKIDPYYLSYLLHSESVRRKIIILAQGISRYNISKKGVMEISTTFPSLDEQDQIGSLFQHIDHTITLHEEKKHQLEQLKSALLQKMFADKSGYPPVRFEGFSDEWEQSKLGDVCEEVSGNNGNVKGLPILTISAANGWMNQKDRFSQVIAGNELKKYTLLKKGHLAYNHGNSKQAKYGTVFVQNLYDQALVPRVYHSFKMKTENNPYYVEYYFATKKLDRELARLVTSGARMDGLLNINKKDFFKIKFEVPTPVEQSLISTILQALDQTITLHDQKLSLLKRVKQTLLQKMFI